MSNLLQSEGDKERCEQDNYGSENGSYDRLVVLLISRNWGRSKAMLGIIELAIELNSFLICFLQEAAVFLSRAVKSQDDGGEFLVRLVQL